MAKSKSGGTRSYIRGKIGADVYSIGKDGKGAKQQVVRSLAEVVSNPQTEAQMRGRMIMSTVMQAVSAMSPIIDHSFDNVPNGQPAISEFISRNYALIKADVAAHPSSSNTFGLNKYQEKGVRAGQYVISSGKAPLIAFVENQGQLQIQVVASESSATATVQDLLTALGITKSDYFTLMQIGEDLNGNRVAVYVRFKVKESVALDGVIATIGIANIFEIESNAAFSTTANLFFEQGKLTIMPTVELLAFGFITSVKVESGWEHSDTTMVNTVNPSWPADTALPTYPTGASRFLNGGDI